MSVQRSWSLFGRVPSSKPVMSGNVHGPRGSRVIWFEIWLAQEGACPVCAPLDGSVFRAGEGPEPPLHRHCRCRRVPVSWQRVDASGRVIARGMAS